MKSILTLIYVLLIFQTVEEGNDEEFEDMMDQLLERDAAGAPAEILAEAIEQHMGGHDSTLDDTHHDSAVSSIPPCGNFTQISYHSDFTWNQ